MKVFKYRRSVFLVRYFLALGFVLIGIWAIHDGIFHDGLILRKALNLVIGIVTLSFFGRILFMLSIVFFKGSVLFSIDDTKIIVHKKEISRKDIRKIEKRGLMPSGILRVQVPGFIILDKKGEKINIPTYFLLTSKEDRLMNKVLTQYVSNHKMKIK